MEAHEDIDLVGEEVSGTRTARKVMEAIHSVAMTGFYVGVPAEAAEALRRRGFVTRGSDRGAGEIVHGVEVALGVAASTVALGADSITILVARHQVRRFFDQLWSRTRSADSAADTGPRRLAMIVSKDGVRRSVTLETDGYGEHPPAAVVDAFVGLIAELAEQDPDSLPERSD
jgi:hypothetical protein